eukprot:475730_1
MSTATSRRNVSHSHIQISTQQMYWISVFLQQTQHHPHACNNRNMDVRGFKKLIANMIQKKRENERQKEQQDALRKEVNRLNENEKQKTAATHRSSHDNLFSGYGCNPNISKHLSLHSMKGCKERVGEIQVRINRDCKR